MAVQALSKVTLGLIFGRFRLVDIHTSAESSILASDGTEFDGFPLFHCFSAYRTQPRPFPRTWTNRSVLYD